MLERLFTVREFTGRHMLGVMLAFFGTIISVNMLMAYFATSTWSGLVVKNSYVESQLFNEHTAERRKMAELGWKGTIAVQSGELDFGLVDREGNPVDAAIAVKLGRPSFEAQDRMLELAARSPGSYGVPVTVGPGIWNADVTATATDGTVWKHSYRFTVKE